MRRTKKEAEKTRKQIMSAAVKVMNKKGISSTRFEDIAKEANVTRGAIYHYFKSKNEILFSLHENSKKQMIELFARHISEDVEPLISLKKGLKEIFYKFEEDLEFRSVEELFLKLEFTSLIREDEELKQEFINEREETICVMLDLVKRGQELGSIRKDIEVENLASSIISSYLGFVTFWLRRIDHFSIKDKADDHINILLNGIVK